MASRRLLIIVTLVATTMLMSNQTAFSDHQDMVVSIPAGSTTPGCETNNACFIPFKITVDIGSKVTWTNDDNAAHTVTSGTPQDGPDGNFDSSIVMAGNPFSHTFTTVGTTPYFCAVHPWMTGVVVVQEATPQTPVPQQGSIELKGLEVMFESQYTQILSGSIDQEKDSLILYVQTSDDDVVTLTIPRSLLDATTPTGQDDNFFVLTDGVETEYEQASSTSSSRTIVILVVKDTKEIEVIGTDVYGSTELEPVKGEITQSPEQSGGQESEPTTNGVGPEIYGMIGGGVAIGMVVLIFATRRKKRKSNDEGTTVTTTPQAPEPDYSLDDSKLR